VPQILLDYKKEKDMYKNIYRFTATTLKLPQPEIQLGQPCRKGKFENQEIFN